MKITIDNQVFMIDTLIMRIMLIILLTFGCTNKGKPEICEIFEGQKVLANMEINYCAVLKSEEFGFKEVPCSVVKVCFPEKLEKK